MSRNDRISSLSFIGLALAIIGESLRLGPGSLSNPGPGLLPLWCGLIQGILGLIIFARTFKGSIKKRKIFSGGGTKITLTLVSLVGYAFLMDLLGFILVTFLWVSFACGWIGKMGWKKGVFTSLVTTALSYFLFARFLTIHFPRGIFGF